MDKKAEILKGVMECVKWGNTLPIGPERDLCVSYPLFVKILKKHEETVTELMNKVLKLQHLPTQVSASDERDVMNEFLSDCVDNIMEKVGLSLDEAAGHKKNVLVVNANVQHVLTRKYSTVDKVGSPFRLTTAKLVARPQINFKVNNKNEPFVPKITDKPNSLRPLAILYDPDENGGQYCHPYEFEIEKFKPLECFITEKLPIEPKPIEATEVILVDSEEKLKTMLSDLETQTEIAVDLESCDSLPEGINLSCCSEGTFSGKLRPLCLKSPLEAFTEGRIE